MVLRRLRVHEHHGCRRIVDARGVRRGHRAVLLEHRLQLRHVFHAGIRAHMLVGGELLHALLAFQLDRHDLLAEVAGLHRARRPPVRFDGELVLLLARETVFGGDVLGGHAHVAVAERIVQRGAHRVDHRCVAHALAPAPRRQHVGGAAHALGAAGHRDIGVAEQNVLRGRYDRLQPGAAQPVHRQARRADRDAGVERRNAREIHVARLAVDHAAHHDVPHARRLRFCSRQRFADGDRAELGRRHVLERAAIVADRRARTCHHHHVRHRILP